MDKATQAEAVSRGQRYTERILNEMTVISHLLEAIRAFATDADPSGGVGRMMRCSWFGDIILTFPQIHAVRVPLATSDDKATLAGKIGSIVNRISVVISTGNAKWINR